MVTFSFDPQCRRIFSRVVTFWELLAREFIYFHKRIILQPRVFLDYKRSVPRKLAEIKPSGYIIPRFLFLRTTPDSSLNKLRLSVSSY